MVASRHITIKVVKVVIKILAVDRQPSNYIYCHLIFGESAHALCRHYNQMYTIFFFLTFIMHDIMLCFYSLSIYLFLLSHMLLYFSFYFYSFYIFRIWFSTLFFTFYHACDFIFFINNSSNKIINFLRL